MEAVLIIVGLFALYEIVTHQQAAAAQSAAIPLPTLQTTQFVPASSSVAGTLQQTGEEAQGVSMALNAVPIVGPVLSSVFSAISGGLLQASAARAKAAVNENSAVAAAVPGWDQGVRQVVAAYNAGQLTAAQVQQFFAVPQVNDATVPSGQGLLWKNFWNECGPQIQSGRNGCQSGTVTQPNNASFCSGSYGASCCVGYDDLKNSSVNLLRALAQAEANPGRPFSASVLIVVASKYGGINRPAYTVTFQKPVSSASSILAL
jgi:hypothetical protein